MQEFVGRILESKDWDESVHAFQLISHSPRSISLPKRWKDEFESALRSSHSATMSLALDALAKINTDRFDRELTKIGDNFERPVLIRIKALGTISKESALMSSAAFTLLLDLLNSASGSLQRMEAAIILSNAALTKKQLLDVVELIKSAGPLELTLLVDIFNQTRDPATGFALVDALENSMSANSLSPSELQRMLARFPPEVLNRAKPLVKQLFDQADQREGRLAAMATELESGDPGMGRDVFTSGKGACITCHTIGDDGREAGPDLSKIGQIRTKQDLLESILFPSVSLARDFEPYLIETTDGQTLLGVIQSETSDTVYLLDATAVAKPIPRSSIKTIQPGPVSLMPQGLDQTMTKQELIDLVAYLDSLE